MGMTKDGFTDCTSYETQDPRFNLGTLISNIDHQSQNKQADVRHSSHHSRLLIPTINPVFPILFYLSTKFISSTIMLFSGYSLKMGLSRRDYRSKDHSSRHLYFLWRALFIVVICSTTAPIPFAAALSSAMPGDRSRNSIGQNPLSGPPNIPLTSAIQPLPRQPDFGDNNDNYYQRPTKPKKRVALITGANKGIGKEIARLLAREREAATGNIPWYIFLGCRDEQKGKEAMDELNYDLIHAGGKIIVCPLDVTDPSSIEAAVEGIRNLTSEDDDDDDEHSNSEGEEAAFSENTKNDKKMKSKGQLDVLINNAGVCFNDSTLYGQVQHTSVGQQADMTFRTNFYGTYSVTQAMLPLLQNSESPRIINMGSAAGSLEILQSPYLFDAFTNPELTLEDLISLLQQFVQDVQTGVHTYNGWPDSSYAVSKLGVVAMTKIMARQYRGIMVNSVDPGFCATDQNYGQGIRSAADGAVVPFRLATMPHDEFVTGMNISD